MKAIHFCATSKQGFYGLGKQEKLIETFQDISLNEFNVSHFLLHNSYDELISSNIDLNQLNIFVLIYSEECTIDEEVYLISRWIKTLPNSLIIHPPELGALIGNKKSTNQLLNSNGISTPYIYEGRATEKVFSNTLEGSGSEVMTFEQGTILNDARYNTKFIDTTHSFAGKSFFVSLRIMAFYDKYISTYVRCRDASENNPSVHAINTPLNKDLLNYLYSEIVLQNEQMLIDLAKKLGEILGPGFFSHDILFDPNSKSLFVCETGFKFDEIALRSRLLALKGKLLMDDLFYLEQKKMAFHFLNYVAQL
jgi:hypothetical protein